jgi:hypothetical protein
LRSIASLDVSVNTPLLIDFSRVPHLDLFEQPEIRFFNNRCSILSLPSSVSEIETLSLAKGISPTGEGVNHIVKRGEVQIVQVVQWFRRLTMTGSIFRSFLR